MNVTASGSDVFPARRRNVAIGYPLNQIGFRCAPQ